VTPTVCRPCESVSIKSMSSARIEDDQPLKPKISFAMLMTAQEGRSGGQRWP